MLEDFNSSFDLEISLNSLGSSCGKRSTLSLATDRKQDLYQMLVFKSGRQN